MGVISASAQSTCSGSSLDRQVRCSAAPRWPARRGAVAPLVVVMMVVLVGFAALAIDVGRMYGVRTELQRTADAAALSAALAAASDDSGSPETRSGLAYSAASDIAMKNKTFMHGSTLNASDVELGTIVSPEFYSSPFIAGATSTSNAVRVTVRRTTSSSDGPIPLTFAQIFGKKEASIIASAVAVFDDRFAGIDPPDHAGSAVIPFSINADYYDEQLLASNDAFGYDNGVVLHVGDGKPEVVLYPDKNGDGNTGNGSQTTNDGSGNFGILNIGVPNVGVPPVEEQILGGVSGDAIEREIGTSELRFVNDDGSRNTYQITGTPGVSGGLAGALEARVGDLVGFFLHVSVVDGGSNATYTIVDLKFGRIMEVDLTGNNKRLVIQPAPYTGSDIITDPGAPPTGGEISGIRLAR